MDSMDSGLTAKRVGWIDALRAFAIILVIIGHANRMPAMLQKLIYGFHMPLFFILAGYLFREEKYEDLSDLVKIKFRQYIVPFFVLGVINLLLNAIRESLSMGKRELLVSTGKHFIWLIYSYGTGNRMPNCTPLWFLTCLFLSTVFLYIFLQCLKKMPDKHIYIYICSISVVVGTLHVMNNLTKHLPWNLDGAVIGAVLMLVGHLWRKENTVEKISLCGSFALLVIGLGTIYVNEPMINLNTSEVSNPLLFFVGSIVTSLAFFALFRQYYRVRLPLLEYIGRNTIIVMGFNYVVKTFVNYCWSLIPAFDGIKIRWDVQCVLVFLLCLIIMVTWSLLKKRFPRIAIF